jgi:hypothetical protein
LPQAFWVEEGRLLAGDHPAGANPSQLRVRLAKLLAAGINSFIDLTMPGECVNYVPLLAAGIRYQRIELVDHQVPSDAALMTQVLIALQRELDEGRRVYLHCRAGIGRTGMAIGCHLVERGQRGRQALETLNQLWRQHVPPNHWRHLPETEAQDAFIIRWQPSGQTVELPTLDTETAPAAQAVPDRTAKPGAPVVPMRRSALRSLPLPLRARARAALLGLAIGDALTAKTLGLPKGQTSDDTAMAVCVVESLVHCRGEFEVRDQIGRFQAWLAEGPAAGARPAVRKAIALASWRRAALTGSHDPQQSSPEALSRCAPAAICFHEDQALAIAAAADIARLTHQAPLVVDSCRLFTAMVHEAVQGKPREAVLGLAARWPAAPLKHELSALAASWAHAPDAAQPRTDGILSVLDLVVRAVARATDFRSGLVEVIRQGVEIDVAAAAYGQLAGALFSMEGIPAEWRIGLSDADSLAVLADRLLICRNDSLQ